jgi:hypothetical protein
LFRNFGCLAQVQSGCLEQRGGVTVARLLLLDRS